MQSGEKQPTNTTNSEYDKWSSLSNVPRNTNSGEKSGNHDSFTNSELKRLAEATGRVPDDEGVISLNLALRYKQYQKYQQLYENSIKTNTMLQQGTLEDIATAKRELEEAMYLYDKNFGKVDEDQRRRELKDSYRRREDLKNGRTSGGGYFEEANIARFARKDDYEKRRQGMSSNLAERLPGLVNSIENSEIYQTYELNKDIEPSIRERREGFQNVGKNGFYTENHAIDWQLYPHAPVESPKTKIEVIEVRDANNPVENNPNDNIDRTGNTTETESSENSDTEAEAKARHEAEEKARHEAEERVKNELEHGEFDLSTPEGREKRKSLISERFNQIKNRLIDIFDLKKAKQKRINEIDLELAKITGKTEDPSVEELSDSEDTAPEEITTEDLNTEKDSQKEINPKANSEIEARRAELKTRLERIEQELQEINRRRAELQGFSPDSSKQEDELDQVFNQVMEELDDKPNEQNETPPIQTYNGYIESQFKDLVGQEGVEFMTSEEAIDHDLSNKIAIWWNGLSEEAKREVVDFEKSSNSSAGNGLRSWLQANNIIEPGPTFEI